MRVGADGEDDWEGEEMKGEEDGDDDGEEE